MFLGGMKKGEVRGLCPLAPVEQDGLSSISRSVVSPHHRRANTPLFSLLPLLHASLY